MSNTTEPSTPASDNVHFCVFIHGLWGQPSHLTQLSKALQTKFADSNIHILVAKRNAGNYTYDGIELGAERTTLEIEDELVELEKQGKKVTKISVIGYSLGGLVARYAIGLLYTKGYFDRMEPVNFTTFATPHLGTRTPLLGWHNDLFNNLGSRTLSVSGQQLWTTDKFQDTGRPILSVLADPSSIFIRALNTFKNRSLYANIVNDRAVPFYTACIEDIDPFVDVDGLNINYAPDTEDVILNHPQSEEPYTLPMASKRTTPPTYYESFSNGARNALNKAPLYLFLCTLAPIGATVFLANAGVQSFKSAQRILDHAEGKGGVEKDKYKVQLMIEGAQRRAEKMMEGMTRDGEEFLDSGEAEKKKHKGASNGHTVEAKKEQTNGETPEEAKKAVPNGKPVEVVKRTTPNGMPVEKHDSAHEDDHLAYGEAYSSRNTSPTPSMSPSQHTLENKDGKEFPTLALTDEQFEMKANLDACGFKKYPVHIKRAHHSHAAIIVRMQRPGFGEGRVVAKHWTERFEI